MELGPWSAYLNFASNGLSSTYGASFINNCDAFIFNCSTNCYMSLYLCCDIDPTSLVASKYCIYAIIFGTTCSIELLWTRSKVSYENFSLNTSLIHLSVVSTLLQKLIVEGCLVNSLREWQNNMVLVLSWSFLLLFFSYLNNIFRIGLDNRLIVLIWGFFLFF